MNAFVDFASYRENGRHPLLAPVPWRELAFDYELDGRFGTADEGSCLFVPDPAYEQFIEIQTRANGRNGYSTRKNPAFTKNPKGYIDRYRPQAKTRQLIAQVQSVLEANAEYLPLTLRQVFYRMIAGHDYPKSENDYEKLGNVVSDMRRAQIIPFDWIRDDGTVVSATIAYSNVANFWESVGETARRYRRDRQAGQNYRLELWCEAGGMVPQLERVAHPYGVAVMSSSGFNSLTAVREVADRVLDNGAAKDGKPTVVLHVGDYDPSGVAMFRAFTEDVGRFVQADRWFHYRQELYRQRVALTLDQVEAHDLIRNPLTAEKRKKNSHAKHWPHDWTVQAEALPPAALAEIVENAIVSWLDQDKFEREKALELPDRAAIERRLPVSGLAANNGANAA